MQVEADPDTLGALLLFAMGTEAIAADAANPSPLAVATTLSAGIVLPEAFSASQFNQAIDSLRLRGRYLALEGRICRAHWLHRWLFAWSYLLAASRAAHRAEEWLPRALVYCLNRYLERQRCLCLF